LPADGFTAALFAVSVLLAGLLQFFLAYAMALLAFWVLEVSTFIFILFAFEYIAGGHLFPLDILPPALAQALNYTPFPYQLYFPISIYMGKVVGTGLWRGILIQALWVLVAYGFARFMWRRGVKRYSAFGG
jgi:ABC-2 type transport system permease protein